MMPAGPSRSQNYKELFNMKHAKVGNVIETTFEIVKSRWAISHSNSFYPIKTQNRIIMVYCLLHNFISTEMSVDPIEEQFDVVLNHTEDPNVEFVYTVESSQQWVNWTEELAIGMYNK